MKLTMHRAFLPIVLGVVLLVGTLWPMVNVEASPGRTALTSTRITTSGVQDTLASANADGNKFYNNSRKFMEIANGYTATITATFETPVTWMGLAIADKIVAVPAGQTYFIGPFRADLYNRSAMGDKGMVYVNYSGVTSVTVAVWELP